MGREQTLLVTVAMLTLGTSRGAIAQSVFPDVPSTHWSYDAVNDLAAHGIVYGYPDRTFRGRQAMTRYEVAASLQRLRLGLQEVLQQRLLRMEHRQPPEGWPPKPIPGRPFIDVPEKHWAAEAVFALHADYGIGTGVLVGYADRKFAGDQAMTRAEFSVALQRLTQETQHWVDLLWKQPSKDKAPLPPTPAPPRYQGSRPINLPNCQGVFADLPSRHWAFDAVNEEAAHGLYTGYPDQLFHARQALTRYEFTVVIQRILQDLNRGPL